MEEINANINIEDLIKMIGGLYIENTVLKTKINSLMEEKKEKNNESKNK